MNKIHNLFTTLLLAVTALALGSCTDEYEYTAATVEGQQVYFSNTLASTQNLSDTESSFNISLNRIMTDGELTVNLTIDDASGIYSMPSSVSFADGEDEVSIPVSYDPTKLEYDVFNDVTIAIADVDYTTPYGNSSYSFSAGMPSPYVSIGTGKFSDTYFGSVLGIESVDVEFLQNQNDPRLIRIVHPYDEYSMENSGDASACSEYLQFYVLKAGDTHPLTGEAVQEDGLVYFDECSTGIDTGYGVPAEIWYPGMLQGGEADNANCRVTAWQDNGLPGTIQLLPFLISNTAEGLYGGQYSSMGANITITFPGYDPKDYSVRVSYLGAFSSADGESFAMGNVTLGADIEEAKVAVVEGNDVNAALSQIMSGAVETTTVTESGEVRIPCKYSGTCTMVAIGYAEGEMQAYNAATFEFTLGPSEWTSIGTGLYTDYIVSNNFTPDGVNPFDPIQYPVEVQENTNTPGVYRVVKPYAPEVYGYGDGFGYDESQSYNIVINASDPDAVYIQTQPTGIDLGGQYGMLYMLSYGGMVLENGVDFETAKANGLINGTLKNGVISFGARELFYTTAADLSDPQGHVYCANPDNAVSVLTLPSAVTEQAKAKAAKSMKVLNGMKLSKKRLSTKNAAKLNRNKKFMLVKAFQLNKNVKLNRK